MSEPSEQGTSTSLKRKVCEVSGEEPAYRSKSCRTDNSSRKNTDRQTKTHEIKDSSYHASQRRNGNLDDKTVELQQLLLERIRQVRRYVAALRDYHASERDRIRACRAAELAEIRASAAKRAKEQLQALATSSVSPFAATQLYAPEQVMSPLEGDVLSQFRRGDAVEAMSNPSYPDDSLRPMASASELLRESEIVSDEAHMAEELILKRAAEITRRNAILARERLPKQPEAPRSRAHWDYLLDEMAWVATDFREERKWKVALAKKVSRLIEKYFVDQAGRDERAKKEEDMRLKRRANAMARDVRRFWSQIRELANYRRELLEEVHEKAERERQLDFLLGETQKFTRLIAEDLMEQGKESVERSEDDRRADFSDRSDDLYDRRSDDAVDERHQIEVDQGVYDSDDGNEIRKLKTEADMPVEEILRKQGINASAYFKQEPEESSSAGVDEADSASEDTGSTSDSAPSPGIMMTVENKAVTDDEFSADSDGADDEQTLEEEERVNAGTSADEEIKALQQESTRPLEAVLAEYIEPLKSPESIATGKVGREAEDCKSPLGRSGAGSAATDGKIQVPFLLKGNLRDYQQAGLEWLVTLHQKNLNGILADEMGLGKTIQAIALLSWLAVNESTWGPHLIIVPTSVLLNWEVEFKKWAPGLKILSYYGSLKERRSKRIGWSRANAFHVCITSYSVAVQDSTVFRRRKWTYMILDEAQNIKNFQSQRWQTLLNFDTKRRLLLTGTPLQNSVMELWSLMHFLMPDVFQSHSEFKDWFSNPINEIVLQEKQSRGKENIVERLHSVLRPFFLRRLKRDVEKGLPEKTEHVRSCRLSKRQRQLYEDFISRKDTTETMQSGNFIGMMNVLMQLRKVCNHPDLFEGRPIISPFQAMALAFQMPSLVASLVQGYHGIANFPERELRMHKARFACRRSNQLSTQLSAMVSDILTVELDSLKMRYSIHANDSKLVERQIRYRSHVLTRNITISSARNSDVAVYGSDLISTLRLARSADEPAISDSRFQARSESFESLYCALSKYATRGKEMIDRFGVCVAKARAPAPVLVTRNYHREELRRYAQYELASSRTRSSRSLFGSAALRSLVELPDPRLVQWDCGKLQELDVLLRLIRKRGDRALIFTQMTRMLDIIESFLNLHDLRYLRLDGSTKTENRQRLVERFNSDGKIFCMILTTRAGGVGLNLTGANCVVFYDSDWNPAIDAQAQDRVHRIGQTKPVHIYRLVSEKTVEENILRKANEKRSLEELVIAGAGFTTDAFQGRLNVWELVTPNTPATLTGTGHTAAQISEQMNQPNGEDDVNQLLLAAEDEREKDALAQTKRERAIDDQDFADNGDGLKIKTSTANETPTDGANEERERILKSLSAVQQHALKFIERNPNEAADRVVDKTDGTDFESSFALERLLERRKQPGAISEDEEEMLVYEADVTHDGYLKAMTDTDNEMKIYLPLRYGGPEELVMSTVVGGTAAAGLQSAEDAAFFPHAYARMGRTERATKRQKEKMAQRRKEEQEKKRKVEEAQRAEKLKQSTQALPAAAAKDSFGSLSKKSRMVPLTSGVASSDSRSSLGANKKAKLPFPLAVKMEQNTQIRSVKPAWTVEEDELLLNLCKIHKQRDYLETNVINENSCRPNFTLVAAWMSACRESLSGQRWLKTATDCRERHKVLRDAEQPMNRPSTEESDSSNLRKHFQSLSEARCKCPTAPSDSGHFVAPHASHSKLLGHIKDTYGEKLLGPADIIKQMGPVHNHRPGYKTGELPAHRKRSLLRQWRRASTAQDSTSATVAGELRASPKQPNGVARHTQQSVRPSGAHGPGPKVVAQAGSSNGNRTSGPGPGRGRGQSKKAAMAGPPLVRPQSVSTSQPSAKLSAPSPSISSAAATNNRIQSNGRPGTGSNKGNCGHPRASATLVFPSSSGGLSRSQSNMRSSGILPGPGPGVPVANTQAPKQKVITKDLSSGPTLPRRDAPPPPSGPANSNPKSDVKK